VVGGTTKIKPDPELDQIIQQTRAELETLRGELDRYKGIFDSARLVIGHEFIKPLTSINGYLELLENNLAGAVGKDEIRYFSKIKMSVNQLEELVDSFVQMLRFDSWSENHDDFEEINLYQLVGEIIGKYDALPGTVENEISGEFPLIYQRKKCLEIILDNLISNALKHGGRSRPAFVRAEIQKDKRKLSTPHQLIVDVGDRGKGIPAAELEEIFNPFYRAAPDGRGQGLGLGLTLVKSVVAIMMGEVRIKSDPARGTIATFNIPLPARVRGKDERIG